MGEAKAIEILNAFSEVSFHFQQIIAFELRLLRLYHSALCFQQLKALWVTEKSWHST